MQKVNLTLTAEHLNVITTALGELPMKVAFSTHAEIARQVQAAQAAADNTDAATADPEAGAAVMTGTDHS